MVKLQRGMGVAALALALAAPGGLAARAQDPAGNGTMSGFAGAGGDPAVGEKLYPQRCASCHDNPQGRTPSKAALASMTPTAIAGALVEGVMRPMAQGLTPKDIASLAAYLSKRQGAGLADAIAEAPACKGKPAPLSLSAPQWNGWGRTLDQARFQPAPGLTATDAPRLKVKWAFAYPGSRHGQATVVGDRLFINSTGGGIYALNARTGCAWWRFDVPGGSRSTVVVGRLPGSKRYAAYFTGWVERTAYALDAATGRLIWKTQVDDQREVQMTGSPALSGGKLFVTVSSAEEAIASDDAYECCKFRGAVVAVDAATGKVLWKTYVAPPAKPFKKSPKGTRMYGPAGAAIWSAPTVDAKRGLVYVATGDSYTDVALDTADAILALDIKSGAVRWKSQLTRDDNYIIGCYRPPNRRANCPDAIGPDHDFGASPILHTLASGKQLILAGQKSSQVYALDPDAAGKLVWEKRLSQGGALGGVEFGMAADANTLYVPIADIFTQGKKASGVHAFRIADGALLWSQTPAPVPCRWKNPYCNPGVSQAVSAMPGVVFGGAMDGHFKAFDAKTGKVIWDYDTAAAPVPTVSGKPALGGVIDGAGPTIAGGMVYVTTGYQGRSGTPGLVLMAFSVDGR